jgi:hypothetical protein
LGGAGAALGHLVFSKRPVARGGGRRAGPGAHYPPARVHKGRGRGALPPAQGA